jgi:tetratricopeptide (TPR) repeat protein
MGRTLGERCGELTAEAEALRQVGRSAEALPRFAEALAIVAQLAKADPGDTRLVRERASILYSLGALHSAEDRYADAITALDECEQVYQALSSQGVADTERLIADVKARRGRAKMGLGRGLSAVLELDEAEDCYRTLFTENQSDDNALDLARVLTLNAEVQFVYGDPDVAVAAPSDSPDLGQVTLAPGRPGGCRLRSARRRSLARHGPRNWPNLRSTCCPRRLRKGCA